MNEARTVRVQQWKTLGNNQPYEGEGQGEVAAAEEPPLAPSWQGGELAADNIIVTTGTSN
jgi:hypothetical protein